MSVNSANKSDKIGVARKEIEQLKTEIETLINSNIIKNQQTIININVPEIETKSNNLNVSDNDTKTKLKHSPTKDVKPYTIKTAKLSPTKNVLSPKSLRKSEPNLDKDDSKVKVKNYDPKTARDFIKKQKQMRKEKQQEEQLKKDTVEIRKQKLLELREKSLRLVNENVKKTSAGKSKSIAVQFVNSKVSQSQRKFRPRSFSRDLNKSKTDLYLVEFRQRRSRSVSRELNLRDKKKSTTKDQNQPIEAPKALQTQIENIPSANKINSTSKLKEKQLVTSLNKTNTSLDNPPNLPLISENQLPKKSLLQAQIENIPYATKINSTSKLKEKQLVTSLNKTNTFLDNPPNSPLISENQLPKKSLLQSQIENIPSATKINSTSKLKEKQSVTSLNKTNTSLDNPPNSPLISENQLRKKSLLQNNQFEPEKDMKNSSEINKDIVKEINDIKQKLENSILNSSTTAVNNESFKKIETDTTPFWLQPAPTLPYPYNFISAVRKKLEIETKRNFIQEPPPLKESLPENTKEARDISIQTQQNDQTSDKKVNVSVQCAMNSDNKSDKINVINKESDRKNSQIFSPQNGELKTFISHKCRRRLYTSVPTLKTPEELHHSLEINNKSNYSKQQQKNETIKTKTSKILFPVESSDSDTTKNIPEISEEEQNLSDKFMHLEQLKNVKLHTKEQNGHISDKSEYSERIQKQFEDAKSEYLKNLKNITFERMKLDDNFTNNDFVSLKPKSNKSGSVKTSDVSSNISDCKSQEFSNKINKTDKLERKSSSELNPDVSIKTVSSEKSDRDKTDTGSAVKNLIRPDYKIDLTKLSLNSSEKNSRRSYPSDIDSILSHYSKIKSRSKSDSLNNSYSDDFNSSTTNHLSLAKIITDNGNFLREKNLFADNLIKIKSISESDILNQYSAIKSDSQLKTSRTIVSALENDGKSLNNVPSTSKSLSEIKENIPSNPMSASEIKSSKNDKSVTSNTNEPSTSKSSSLNDLIDNIPSVNSSNIRTNLTGSEIKSLQNDNKSNKSSTIPNNNNEPSTSKSSSLSENIPSVSVTSENRVEINDDLLKSLQAINRPDFNDKMTVKMPKTNTKNSENVLQTSNIPNLSIPSINLRIEKENSFKEQKVNSNQIHLTFQAEVHLLNSFNRSLQQIVAVDKSLFGIEDKENIEADGKSFETVNTEMNGLPIDKAIERNQFSSINFQRGCGDASTNHLNDDLNQSSICSSNDINFSHIVPENDNVSNTIASIVSKSDENVLTPRNPYATTSLKMFDRLIQDEDLRLEYFKEVLKLRDKALCDKTKGELAWLEIQKKEYRKNGQINDVTMIKKRQRGLLIKLEQERHEMQRLKQVHKQAARDRKNALREQKKLIKLQLSSTDQIPAKLRRLSQIERRQSGPFKVYRVATTASSNTEIKSETTTHTMSRKSSSASLAEEVNVTTSSASIRTQISERIVSETTEIVRPDSLALKPVQRSTLQTEKVKRALLMKEADLERRRKEAEELLKWHHRLKAEEAKVIELERQANLIPTDDSEQQLKILTGLQLNKLWRNITGSSEKRFDDHKRYQMSKKSLKFFLNAKQHESLEVKSITNSHYDDSYTSDFDITQSPTKLTLTQDEPLQLDDKKRLKSEKLRRISESSRLEIITTPKDLLNASNHTTVSENLSQRIAELKQSDFSDYQHSDSVKSQLTQGPTIMSQKTSNSSQIESEILDSNIQNQPERIRLDSEHSISSDVQNIVQSITDRSGRSSDVEEILQKSRQSDIDSEIKSSIENNSESQSQLDKSEDEETKSDLLRKSDQTEISSDIQKDSKQSRLSVSSEISEKLILDQSEKSKKSFSNIEEINNDNLKSNQTDISSNIKSSIQVSESSKKSDEEIKSDVQSSVKQDTKLSEPSISQINSKPYILEHSQQEEIPSELLEKSEVISDIKSSLQSDSKTSEIEDLHEEIPSELLEKSEVISDIKSSLQSDSKTSEIEDLHEHSDIKSFAQKLSSELENSVKSEISIAKLSDSQKKSDNTVSSNADVCSENNSIVQKFSAIQEYLEESTTKKSELEKINTEHLQEHVTESHISSDTARTSELVSDILSEQKLEYQESSERAEENSDILSEKQFVKDSNASKEETIKSENEKLSLVQKLSDQESQTIQNDKNSEQISSSKKSTSILSIAKNDLEKLSNISEDFSNTYDIETDTTNSKKSSNISFEIQQNDDDIIVEITSQQYNELSLSEKTGRKIESVSESDEDNIQKHDSNSASRIRSISYETDRLVTEIETDKSTTKISEESQTPKLEQFDDLLENKTAIEVLSDTFTKTPTQVQSEDLISSVDSEEEKDIEDNKSSNENIKSIISEKVHEESTVSKIEQKTSSMSSEEKLESTTNEDIIAEDQENFKSEIEHLSNEEENLETESNNSILISNGKKLRSDTFENASEEEDVLDKCVSEVEDNINCKSHSSLEGNEVFAKEFTRKEDIIDDEDKTEEKSESQQSDDFELATEDIEDKSIQNEIDEQNIVPDLQLDQLKDATDKESTNSSSNSIEEDISEHRNDENLTESPIQLTPETDVAGVSHIDIRKRVSEILADATSPRGDKSPRVQDLYVTTYDVMSPSPEGTPEIGSPTNDNQKEKQLFDKETPYRSEAEELLRKQLEIEQEIKQLEKQQQNIPYLYMREIPNKPPPPYKPPEFPVTPVVASVIPVNQNEVETYVNQAADILFAAHLSGTLNDVTFTNQTDDENKIDSQRYIFDLSKKITLDIFKEPDDTMGPSWKLKKNKKFACFKMKKPTNKDELSCVINKKVLELLNFETVNRNDSLIIRWSRKKRDHVDEILVLESQTEESEWTNYDEEEAMIKEDLTNEIMNMLITETAQVFRDILNKKNSK